LSIAIFKRGRKEIEISVKEYEIVVFENKFPLLKINEKIFSIINLNFIKLLKLKAFVRQYVDYLNIINLLKANLLVR
jgi:hypothetical protein